jgi:hypothetical protein
MRSKLTAALVAFAFAAAALAAPAPWYKWRSKLNGKETCAQTMQGEWEKVSGPYKDARCVKPGVPG